MHSEIVSGQVSHKMELHLPSGVYILKIAGEERILTQKIIHLD